MKRALLAFFAGFLATLVFHQPMLWILKTIGMIDRAPYDMKPVPPFGVPASISLAFWGGVWGIVMIAALSRIRSEKLWWLAAIVFGAVLPTLVAGLVVAPLKHITLPRTPAMIAVGLLVNAAWGLGTAIVYRLTARSR